jgi:hypothetical protein
MMDIEEVKNNMLTTLLTRYLEVCHETDNEYLKEAKRKEAGIAKEKDITDKQAVLTRYKDATLKYEDLKLQITEAQSIKELEVIDITIE